MNQLKGLGCSQRILEKMLKKGMSNKEIAQKVLMVSTNNGLSSKCWNILEKWALNTYKAEGKI